MKIPRTLPIAIIQAAFGDYITANISKVENFTRAAAKDGVKVILAPELFQGPYFCKTEDQRHFAAAFPIEDHPVVTALAPLTGELQVVLPLSVFERDGDAYYNSIVMADADRSIMGVYRKSHIPDGPGYEEKFYFASGNTVSKFGKQDLQRLASAFAGINGFPKRPA